MRDRSWVLLLLAIVLLLVTASITFYSGFAERQHSEIPNWAIESFREFVEDSENLSAEEFLRKYFPEGFGNDTVVTIYEENNSLDLY